MIIGGKCSLDVKQINERKKSGAHFLEFHTEVNDFKENNKSNLKKIKSILKDNNLTCYCVHSPMTNYSLHNCCLSETSSYLRKENLDLIIKSIEYANYLCECKNPIIVIHPSSFYSIAKGDYSYTTILERSSIFEEDIMKLNEYVLSNYPHITIGIENTTPIVIPKKNNDVIIHNGFIYPEFIDYINSLNLSNVKIVLDICHALSTIRFDSIVRGGFNPLTLRMFLEKSIKNLALIHLNNLIDLGEISQKHSTSFKSNSSSDLELLIELFNFLKYHNYDSYITIEVLEKDYLDCINFRETIETINMLISKKKI